MYSRNHGKIEKFSDYAVALKAWKLWRGRGYTTTSLIYDEDEDEPYSVIVGD